MNRVAGRDTTSCTLTYATKFLGENPAVLTRLRGEGFFELGADAPISWEESKSIPYADAVINEVLRMAPPVSAIANIKRVGEYGKKN